MLGNSACRNGNKECETCTHCHSFLWHWYLLLCIYVLYFKFLLLLSMDSFIIVVLKKKKMLWQDPQPRTTFRSSLAKYKGMKAFTAPTPWTSNLLPILAWSLNFHAGLRPQQWTDQSKVGRSGHQITSLYLLHNIFPWSLLLHILSQYWQMLTRPQRR